MPDLDPVYAGLRRILEPYAAEMNVSKDSAEGLHLDTHHRLKNDSALFFGAVQRRKAHVSFHLMPVYLQPALLDGVSPVLRARMHGKSCFNFTRVDVAAFRELDALTRAGYASYKAQGFV